MNGYKQIVFWSARVRCSFPDTASPAMPEEIVQGTGFWIIESGGATLATNRHVVDANYGRAKSGSKRLSRLEIEFRHFEAVDDGYIVHPDTEFFSVDNVGASLISHQVADCAILRRPDCPRPEGFKRDPFGFRLDLIADGAFLESSVEIMDAASFIGFPQPDGQPWWDTRSNQPIARTVTLELWGSDQGLTSKGLGLPGTQDTQLRF